MFAIIIMYLTIALAFIVAKITLQYGSPFFTVAFRTILAGTCFLLFQFISDRKKIFVNKNDLMLFMKTSLFYVYLVFIPEFWALEKLSASKVMLIYTLTPFVVAFLSYFLVKEQFSLKKIIGMIIGLAGMFVIFITKDSQNGSAEIFYISTREAALLVSVFSYGYAWFLIQKLKNRGYTLAMINGITMLVGGIGAAITSFFYEGLVPINNIPYFILWATLLTILANGIFYTMYGWLLHYHSFTLLSFASFLTPVFGMAFGWLILNEILSIYHIASLGLICIGLYLFYQEEIKKISKK
jgi:drug/metabolite transporter (DMT)-like permease